MQRRIFSRWEVGEEMKKTICDYCDREINEPFSDFRGDLDGDHLAVIEIKPIALNSPQGNISHPDLCRECIIKVLRG